MASVRSYLVTKGVYVRLTSLIFAASDLEFPKDRGRRTNTVFNTYPEMYLKKKKHKS